MLWAALQRLLRGLFEEEAWSRCDVSGTACHPYALGDGTALEDACKLCAATELELVLLTFADIDTKQSEEFVTAAMDGDAEKVGPLAVEASPVSSGRDAK